MRSSQRSWTRSQRDVRLNASRLQLSALQPLGGCQPPASQSPPRPPTPRDLVRTTVPGACTFGTGAFSFWQPLLRPVLCQCLISSLRSTACQRRRGRGSGSAADPDRADVECQARLTRAADQLAGALQSAHCLPSSGTPGLHTSLHMPLGPSCPGVTADTALSPHSTVQAREVSTLLVLVRARREGTVRRVACAAFWSDWGQVKRLIHILRLRVTSLLSAERGPAEGGRVGLATGT